MNDLELQQLQSLNSEDQKQYEDALVKRKTLQDNYENANHMYTELRSQFVEKQKSAKWCKENSNQIQMPDELKQKVEEICPSTLPEVKAALENLRNQLKVTISQMIVILQKRH